MRAAHWLVGCTLCIAGIGGASAASVDSQDLDNSSRTIVDSSSTHESNSGSGGDATGLRHDCQPASNDGSGSTPSSTHSGGSSSAPTSSQRSHLGWQSLLPGSIQ